MTACIVGWSHGKFGKLDGETSESLIVKAATEAIAHAGIEPKDVDVIYVGNMNGGFVRQEFHSSLALQAHPDLRFKPSTRVENACATGSAAIHMGLNTLAAGKARFVLVVGVEKMTELNSAQAGEVLIKASYVAEEANIEAGFAGIFGKITSAYFQRYGDKSDALAKIAVKAHKNGAKNPYAHFQKEFAYEFCRNPSDKNPFVAGPLKRTDCSPVTDGAAAVILTDVTTALGMKQAIAFRAAEQVNDFLPMSRRDIVAFEGCERAWAQAFAAARLGGRINMLGTPSRTTEVNFARDLIFKGLTLYGVTGRRMYRTWDEMQRFLRAGELDPRPVITHRFPLERIADAIQVIKDGSAGKVILEVAQ